MTPPKHPKCCGSAGSATPPKWWPPETGAPSREIHAIARTGKWLNQFPVFAQAAADGVLTLRHLKELKSLDKPHRHDALLASQDELVAAARDHDFVEFTNRLTVWLMNHTTAEEVAEQVKKTSCSWNTNTDGSIDGRFHLDPLSAAAVGTALGDEMQRLFHDQSQGDGTADTISRRRGQALVGLIVGGAEAPGSAYGLAAQVQLEFACGKLAQSTLDPAMFAEGKLGFAGRSPAIRRYLCDPDNKWKRDLVA